MSLHLIFYSVGLGQCIAVIPDQQREYCAMIDCGHDGDFHPIDDLVQYLPGAGTGGLQPLHNLTVTNYDHDHFSGLPYLKKNCALQTVTMPNNISMPQLLRMKSETTEALHVLGAIRDSYNAPADGYTPPYTQTTFSLTQEELHQAGIPIQTNHLSQVVFIEYGDQTVCIPGDLEARSWELMLQKPAVRILLRLATVFVASHHGRENGYHAGVFDYCNPDCIIISDKYIVHGTQEDMSALYAKHVDEGVSYMPRTGNPVIRKVLTTRNDGHLLLTISAEGEKTFQAYK